MNHLNSILLEGAITGDISKDENGIVTWFLLATQNKGEITFMKVKALDRLAEAVSEKGGNGALVRVVGSVRSRQVMVRDTVTTDVYVKAEHIEFRPKKEQEVVENDDREVL